MSDANGAPFAARERTPPDGRRRTDRIAAKLARLRSRFDRATRDGRAAFTAPDSDAYDVGLLAVINLADLVTRALPRAIVDALPAADVEGLRATRDIAAHDYAAMDNSRLWITVTESAPRLLDQIERALRSQG